MVRGPMWALGRASSARRFAAAGARASISRETKGGLAERQSEGSILLMTATTTQRARGKAPYLVHASRWR